MVRQELPNPAFWAITESNGAQLIEPGSDIHTKIVEKLGSASTLSVVEAGDILIISSGVSQPFAALNPESIGIRRTDIAAYPPAPKQ